MKKHIPEGKSDNIHNEDEVDSCCCQFDASEEVPDEDLPASVGGVE